MGFNQGQEAGMKTGNGKWQVAAALVLAGVVAAQGAQAAAPSVKLYGQVNRGLLWADDGDKGKLYFVDNKNSSTRFGIDAKAALEGGSLTAGAKIEAEIQSNSTGDINQTLEKISPVTFTERHLDFYLAGPFGKFSLGQGDMASNNTSEVDLSGTSVVGFSDVRMFAGGIIFFDNKAKSVVDTKSKPATLDKDGKTVVAAVDTKYNPKIKDVFDNLDGLSRDDRVRYDTPKVAGFQVSASAAVQKAWDAALRYGAEFGGMKMEAAVAYSDFGDQNKHIESQVNGSLSVLTPFGLSVTGAAGQQKLDDPARKEDPMFYYAKLGYTGKFIFAGSTSFAVDYSATNDMKKDKDEAKTIGAFVVQRLDNYATELYLGYRTHSLDRTGKDYADVGGMMAGARIKF
jgi:predicted porin